MKESKRTEGEISLEKLREETVREWISEKRVAQDEKKETVNDLLPPEDFLAVKTEEDIPEGDTLIQEIKEKIKVLLNLGEKKGLAYAVKEAERSNNPLLTDLFHDILVKDRNYERFLKK